MAAVAAPPAEAKATKPGQVTKMVVAADRATGKLGRRSVVVERPLPSAAVAGGVKKAEPKPPAYVERLLRDAAARNDVDPALVGSVIRHESAFNLFARSPKGAMGLMQLMPGTAKQYGADNPYDPRQNVEAGVKYLKHLQEMFDGDLSLTLAAYNAGEGAVAKYGKQVPPYRETVDYVAKVSSSYQQATKVKPAIKPEAEVAKVAAVENSEPVAEKPRPVQLVIDAQGRLFLRTP